MIVVFAIALVCLIFFWFNGDYQTRTKFILTGICLLSWGSIVLSPIILYISQTLLAIVLGGMTFGVAFLNQRVG